MLTLTLEAKTYVELVDKAKAVLGLGLTETSAINVVTVPLNELLTQPVVITEQSSSTPTPSTEQPRPYPEPKRRGRPPKVKDAAQETVVPPSTGPSPAPSTPAPVAAVSDPSAAPVAGFVATFDQMKAALQKVAMLRKGETYDMAGLTRASKILSQFKTTSGETCRKVKEVKPEDYAAVIGICEVS